MWVSVWFHRALVFVDLAMELRTCGASELGAGRRGVRPKAVDVLPVAALREGRHGGL